VSGIQLNPPPPCAADPHPAIPVTPPLPADPVGQYVASNESRIWYARWDCDSPKERVPVLLLHGGLLNSDYFGALIPVLLAYQYTVIAMDSRGQGRSSYAGGPITYQLMEQDVLALLDVLHIPTVSLVGWSDGGIIGIELAISHPDRLQRLFAFGANTYPSGNIENADSLPTVVAHAALEESEYRALSPHPERWPQVRAAINYMWGSLPQITTAQLNSIRIPTTIAAGQYDEFIKPEHTRYIAAQIPGARLVILPTASHFAMIQEPEAFSRAVLEFLAR
jgi:pimeloyl-ACP methyl ester carboxylesterase